MKSSARLKSCPVTCLVVCTFTLYLHPLASFSELCYVFFTSETVAGAKAQNFMKSSARLKSCPVTCLTHLTSKIQNLDESFGRTRSFRIATLSVRMPCYLSRSPYV